MKTIEERADLWATYNHTTKSVLTNCREEGYIQGATEQRDIDIQRACEWLDEHLYDYLTSDGPMEQYYIKRDNLIEDFKQTMKEE